LPSGLRNIKSVLNSVDSEDLLDAGDEQVFAKAIVTVNLRRCRSEFDDAERALGDNSDSRAGQAGAERC
jgi:hypothetical protein